MGCSEPSAETKRKCAEATTTVWIEPMTEDEHIATLVALATMLDQSGCPSASITEATDEGVSIALHFGAERARKLIECVTHPSPPVVDGGR